MGRSVGARSLPTPFVLCSPPAYHSRGHPLSTLCRELCGVLQDGNAGRPAGRLCGGLLSPIHRDTFLSAMNVLPKKSNRLAALKTDENRTLILGFTLGRTPPWGGGCWPRARMDNSQAVDRAFSWGFPHLCPQPRTLTRFAKPNPPQNPTGRRHQQRILSLKGNAFDLLLPLWFPALTQPWGTQYKFRACRTAGRPSLFPRIPLASSAG